MTSVFLNTIACSVQFSSLANGYIHFFNVLITFSLSVPLLLDAVASEKADMSLDITEVIVCYADSHHIRFIL